MTDVLKNCVECQKSFAIDEKQQVFLENVSPRYAGVTYRIPLPTRCPDCRRQARLSYRNERKLYHRLCDYSHKPIVSMFSPDKAFKVYREQDWWSDGWDPLKYGKDFDFSRPFFEQFRELMSEVPLLSRNILLCENSEYVNGAANCKNCYLSFNLDYSEDSYYVTNAKHCRNCIDSYVIRNSELCLECMDTENGYRLAYSQQCVSCSDSLFLSNCLRCKSCIGCVNLVDQEYCIFNQKVDPQEFERVRNSLKSRFALETFAREFESFALQFPRKHYFGHSNENSSGDSIQHLKNSRSCYECSELEDCDFCYYLFQAKNCMDYDIFGDHSEWIYNCIAVGLNCSRNRFCYGTWNGSSNNLYCLFLGSSSNNFGCIGLKRKEYCIFNKQYTKEEYETLVPRIIQHMEKTGEWGEFFPARLSPFAYNESVAGDQFPLMESEALARDFAWKSSEEANQYEGFITSVPDHIDESNEDICKSILKCEVTEKLYKILPQEFAFYQDMKLPLPRRCPDQRHLDRMTRRNPRHLWDRTCSTCSSPIQTSYAPDRPEKVLCEACYLKAVY